MAIVSFKELISQAMAQNKNQHMITMMIFGTTIKPIEFILTRVGGFPSIHHIQQNLST